MSYGVVGDSHRMLWRGASACRNGSRDGSGAAGSCNLCHRNNVGIDARSPYMPGLLANMAVRFAGGLEPPHQAERRHRGIRVEARRLESRGIAPFVGQIELDTAGIASVEHIRDLSVGDECAYRHRKLP
jgi:hypothetical protein